MIAKLRPYIIPLLIILGSMLLRAYYVDYIDIYHNQHDGGYPYTRTGQLGYISWYLTNWKLPDFDVRTADQFWHPPLHFLLCALTLKTSWTVFPWTNGNFEIAQLVPYLAVTLSIFVIWRLLTEFFGEAGHETIINLLLLLAAFHPGMVIRSACLTNDALATLLGLTTLYLALKWYRNAGMSLMVSVAISFALAMMTKKSSALIALPVGFLFVMKFVSVIRSEDFRKGASRLLSQFAAFLIIAVPLSLWWYVRNLVLYNVPFDFIWNVPDTAGLDGYLGDVPILRRIFDFSPRRFLYRNTYVQYIGADQDINPLVVLWKTAVSDLWSWTYESGRIMKLSYLLLILWVVMMLCATAGMVSLIGRRKEDGDISADMTMTLGILLMFVIHLLSYYSFSFRYPFVWSMDYRYVGCIMICELIFSGEFLRRIWKYRPVRYAAAAGIVAFAALSVLFFVFARGLF